MSLKYEPASEPLHMSGKVTLVTLPDATMGVPVTFSPHTVQYDRTYKVTLAQ